MHICTDCGCENNNTHSTSLCRECQLVLMLNLADDSEKSAQHRVQLTALRVGGLALCAGIIIGWIGRLAFIGGN